MRSVQPTVSRTARLAPLRRQAADLSTNLTQCCCGQQRLSHHLLAPARPPRPDRPHQAAVPACACAAPCKADCGAAARACLAPAREPLSGANGSPHVRRRLLVPAAARRAAPLGEHRKQQPAAREERGAGLMSKRLKVRIGRGYGARASASPRTLSGTETALECGAPPRASHASPRRQGRRAVPRPRRRVRHAAPYQLTAKHGSSRLAAQPPLPRPLQPPPPPAAQRACRQQRALPSLPRVLLPTPQGTHSLRARGAGLEQRQPPGEPAPLPPPPQRGAQHAGTPRGPRSHLRNVSLAQLRRPRRRRLPRHCRLPRRVPRRRLPCRLLPRRRLPRHRLPRRRLPRPPAPLVCSKDTGWPT